MANHPNRIKVAALKALAKEAGMTFGRNKDYDNEWTLNSGRGLKKYLMGNSIAKIDEEAFKLDIRRLIRANQMAADAQVSRDAQDRLDRTIARVQGRKVR